MIQIEVSVKAMPGSPIGFSREWQSQYEKAERGKANEQDEAHFRERLHVNENGHVVFPSYCFKKSMITAALYKAEKVPGMGNHQYRKYFESGVLQIDVQPKLLVGGKTVGPHDAHEEKLFVPSDGKKGGGTRVWRRFPVFESWESSFNIAVLEPILIETKGGKSTCPKVREYLDYAGLSVGIGFWRPERGGEKGRFIVTKFVESEYAA